MRTRGILAFLTSVLVASAALLVGATPAQAAVTTWISVKTPSGSIGPKVLEVANWSTGDRATVHIWTLRTSGNVSNQRWTIKEEVPLTGMYSIRNVNSGKCLDKSLGAPDGNGNAVYQFTCNPAAANQLWQFLRVEPGNNWGMLRSYSGGRCLDVQGKSFTNGARLQVWDCVGDWNQRFNIF